MLIYDDLYKWDGWGGMFKLGSGRCRLRIFDLKKKGGKSPVPLKPFIIIVTDIPFAKRAPNQMTIKSCASHIATKVVREFKINPTRMVWIEYYPEDPDNYKLKYKNREFFEEVEFTWHGDYALQPGWKPLNPAMEKLVKSLLEENNKKSGT